MFPPVWNLLIMLPVEKLLVKKFGDFLARIHRQLTGGSGTEAVTCAIINFYSALNALRFQYFCEFRGFLDRHVAFMPAIRATA
jgi:hypothetical protein